MEERKNSAGQKAGRIYTVRLEGMEFFAFHGVFAREKSLGNNFIVDVEYTYSSVCSKTDSIEDAVDYSEIYSVTSQVMQTSRNLLETLSDEICRRLLEQFPKIDKVQVCVKKSCPPLGGKCEYSSVTTSSERK